MKRIGVKEAADQLGLSATAVREYVKLGLLAGINYGGKPGRGRRIFLDSAEVAAFAKGGAPAAQAYREQQADAAIPKLRGRGRKVPA